LEIKGLFAPRALKKANLEEKKSLTINSHTAQNVTISSTSKFRLTNLLAQEICEAKE